MNIGEKLKQFRVKANLTQEQAAQAAGVSRQTMSNWENGRSVPDILSVARMAELYGITLDELVREPEQAQPERISFLKRYWELLYSAAVASLPLAVLAGHFWSQGAALVLLALGAALFAVPRALFAKTFGGGWRNVLIGMLGWALVVARSVWMLFGGRFNLAVHMVVIIGVALVLYVRLPEQGGWRTRHSWHQWVVLGLIALAMILPGLSGAVEDGGFNAANPFEHPYRIAEAEYGEKTDGILVELGYENELRFLDAAADTARSVGWFTYQEPAEGEQSETLAGIWQMVPEENADMLYRLTVDSDGVIRLSHWDAEVLQYRWRLERADGLRWSLKTAGAVSGGVLEWFPAGSFDGEVEQLNIAAIIGGRGTVAIVPEIPAPALTLYERRGETETERSLTANESGGYSLEFRGEPGEILICRIPWEDGDYWFAVKFE